MGAIEEVKEYFKAMLDNPRIEDVYVFNGTKYGYTKIDTIEEILTMNKDICEIIDKAIQPKRIVYTTMRKAEGRIKYICGNCDTSLKKKDVFCSNCGTKIDWRVSNEE